MTAIKRYQIRGDKFHKCPELQEPLNQALINIQNDVSAAVQGVVRLQAIPPVDVVVSSNSPGELPWPLRLANATGAPLGAALIRIENLTTAGVAGVGVAPVSITSQHIEGRTVLIDFISGLTLGNRYRVVFGVYNNA